MPSAAPFFGVIRHSSVGRFGVKVVPSFVVSRTPLKTCFRHHTDTEICAIAAAEVKLLQWQAVDVVAAAL